MRSRVIVIVVAVLLGVTAALVTGKYLADQQSRIAAGAKLVPVLVAQQDLPEGMTTDELLSKGYLTVRNIPRAYVAASAVSSRGMLQGKVVAQPISKDEQVTKDMFKFATEVGLASSTPKDYIAVSVPYTSAMGVGGLIRPGDSVAVMGTFEPGSKGVSGAVTRLILPKVKVLAVGTAVDEQSAQQQTQAASTNRGLANAQSTSQTGPTTITLAVTPADAQKLVFAQQEGTVWLGLYSPTDPNTPAPTAATYRTVSR